MALIVISPSRGVIAASATYNDRQGPIAAAFEFPAFSFRPALKSYVVLERNRGQTGDRRGPGRGQ